MSCSSNEFRSTRGKPRSGRHRWPLLLGACLAACAAPLAADDAAVAITANGTPVVELYRNRDGSVRYQLNDDLALGMSLGLSPIRLARGDDPVSTGGRWLPVFDLYPDDAQPLALPEQSEREARARRWFWTVGSHTNLVAGDSFDFESDLAQHFSLQTKAGFLIPLGRRWLFGGALTLDHVPGDVVPADPRGSGTSVGAFLGLEFSY